ncbi:signal peptide-containing protein with transmembrane domain [Cryptosporidium felis]|nr:signal peptide-containing protein with transmembrane domain [Cryptosporidium felis]
MRTKSFAHPYLLLIVGVIGFFGIKDIESSIVTEIKSKPIKEPENDLQAGENRPSTVLPSSISKYPNLLGEQIRNHNTQIFNFEDEVATAQYYSKMSKIYSKTPKFTKRTVYPNFSSNYLPADKFVEDFYVSGSMLTLEGRIDEECAGQLLDAEGISKSKVISFKCPPGSTISYLKFEYSEMIFKPKKSKSSDPEYSEIAITGLGFGCDDNQSFIQVGSLANIQHRLSIPQMKKIWINKFVGFIEKSITGQEFLSGFSASGSDGTFGVNIPNNDFHIAFDIRENPPVLPAVRPRRTREWSGSFITGGCIGINSTKRGIFINRIAMIPIKIQPAGTIPLNTSPDSYEFIHRSVKATKVFAIPKLWPECQMIFGSSSGKYQSHFYLFKLPNRETQLSFNKVEVSYSSKQIPISIEFTETVSESSLLLGVKAINDPSIIRVSRTGSISQITIGITEENISKLELGFISYLEVVIDGINTIFIQERVPTFKKTFSGEKLKYICAEISSSGALLGFGAFFGKRLYVTPFIQAGVQTHYSDIQAIFSSENLKSNEQRIETNKIQYLLPKHKKRSIIPVVDFISDRTIDVYQGKSITGNVCDFGSSDLNDDFDYYLVACKPGYFLKGLHVFSPSFEDIIKAFQIVCGNGEVRIGDKTPNKSGITIVDDIQEPQSLGFEIGYKGSNLSRDFFPVSVKIFSSDEKELFHHRTVDKKLKKVVTSDSKIEWKFSKDGSFKGICFAFETVNRKSLFRGITLAKPDKTITRQISDSVVRPNIFYPTDYRAFGLGYIAFGDVAIATRMGSSTPEECRNKWLIEQKNKKISKSKDLGTFSFTCPKGQIITHIHARSNKSTGLMGIIGLLCSDSYSGAIIGTSRDLFELRHISLVENLLSISPPYYIKSVLAGIPRIYNDKFLGKLETFPQKVQGSSPFYSYLSNKENMGRKKAVKSFKYEDGPFDTFCTLVQSKLIRNSQKLKEGILNIGLKPSPKFESLKGGNPVEIHGEIYVNQISYPQCQMIRAPLSTEIRETFVISCPDSSSFRRIIPLKFSSKKNSKIVAFVIECENGGRSLVGYSSIKINLGDKVNIPEDYKAFSTDLPIKYLTEIDVSFDFKQTGIWGFDLFVNDGRTNSYPIGVNKEEIITLFTRRFIGNSLKMICFEFGEKSREITGFGAYFKSQGLYWESEFILPPTQFPFIKEKKKSKDLLKPEISRFFRVKDTYIISDPERVCKDWGGAYGNTRGGSSFGISCGASSFKEVTLCLEEEGGEITGIEVNCDGEKESSFAVGICNKNSLRKSSEMENVSEMEFGFSKESGIFSFFLVSDTDGIVLKKYRSDIIEKEGLGSSVYWTSDSNNGQMLNTLCFNVDEQYGKIRGIGVPFRNNGEIWKKEEFQIEEEIPARRESWGENERHYASEPVESRTVRGVPKVNSETDLEGVKTLTLNELYGGYITHDKNEFSTYCRKLVGIHKESSKQTAVLCPINHRVATIMLYLSSPVPDGRIVGFRIACHGQFKSERVSVDDEWTGMFDIGTRSEHILKQGVKATIFKRLSFGMNSDNRLVYVYASDEVGRRYLKYSEQNEVVAKMTEYYQGEEHNYLRGVCFEMEEEINRIGFVIE